MQLPSFSWRDIIRLLAFLMKAWQNRKIAQAVRQEREMNAKAEKLRILSRKEAGKRIIYAEQARQVRYKANEQLKGIDAWEKKRLGL